MLAIKVETENWQTHDRIPAERLRDLVHRIGSEGDRFLVVQRVPDIPDVFLQVWHEQDDDYELQHRSGPGDRLFGTEIGDADRVTEVMTRWARQEDGWDAELDWERLEAFPTEETPEPDPAPGILSEIEDHVRDLLRAGYGGRAQLTEAAEEWLVVGDERPVSTAQAGRIVDRLWLERLAEQETWTDVTDPELIEQAFRSLEETGITARENFTCCRSCGVAEIGGERGAEFAGGPAGETGERDPRGFVFFHSQGTESAAAGHGLALYYGGFDGSTERTAEIGREVVEALTAVGLTTGWDGSPDQAITLPKLDWRKRLTG